MVKRLLKIIAYTLAALVLLALGLRFMGYRHFGLMLPNTVLEGRWGPTIDQYTIYSNNTLKASKPEPWGISDYINSVELNEREDSIHEAMQSVAFLVARKGEIIFEKYWEDYSAESHTNSWSMAKSVVNILIGVALKDGLIGSLDDKVSDYLPDYELGDITIRHLLMMSSGLNFGESYLNPVGYAARALYGPDLKRLHRSYKPVSEPGQVFEYKSGNTQLLGFILEKVTGQSVSSYAEEQLWQRIGAEHDAFWSLDSEGGSERAFCCLNSNVRDFSRIGELYRRKGIWNGDTIVDYEYWKLSTDFAPILDKDGTENKRYGHHWWVAEPDSSHIFYMRGVAGQYVIVIPEEELVISRLGRKRYEAPIDGHPWDWHQYLRMGRRIAAETDMQSAEVEVLLQDSLHATEEVLMAP